MRTRGTESDPSSIILDLVAQASMGLFGDCRDGLPNEGSGAAKVGRTAIRAAAPEGHVVFIGRVLNFPDSRR